MVTWWTLMNDEIRQEGCQIERGLIDTNIVILQQWIATKALPKELAISAITLAELSAGPNSVTGANADAQAERARRIDILQRTEHEFDPIPFDVSAARIYGRLVAAVIATGRSTRRRTADLMIAAIAAANNLPLFTTNPNDYKGLEELGTIIPIPRPTQHAVKSKPAQSKPK